MPEADRDGDLVEGYSRLLDDPDPAVREKAARDWCDWEEAHVSERSDQPCILGYGDPLFRMRFARLVIGCSLAALPALARLPACRHRRGGTFLSIRSLELYRP